MQRSRRCPPNGHALHVGSGKTGPVFTSLNGTPKISNEGYRRLIINGCFWALGMEDAIKPDADIDFIKRQPQRVWERKCSKTFDWR